MKPGTAGLFSFVVLAGVLAFSSVACRSVNQYENNYTPSAGKVEFIKAEPGTRPELYEIEDWAVLRDFQEKEHYAVIGFSVFKGNWAPRCDALKCAEKIGAPLVLVYSITAEPDSPQQMSVPDHFPACGVFLPSRNYGWIKRSHGITPVTTNAAGAGYFQYAYYLAKRRHVNSFGVYFLFPSAAGGDARVRVSLVVPGSPAARQGIRPGDTVVSVNGRRVFAEADVMPYAVNREEIVRMEVSHD